VSIAATASAAATAAVEVSPSYLDLAFTPLEALSKLVAFQWLGLSPSSSLGSALQFFLYDVPKVFILLTVMIFAVTIVRSFFPPEKTRKRLEGLPLFTGNFLAAGLGVLTPF
jgi:uncharacterized protein